MKHYSKMTFWENKSNRTTLNEYRKHLQEYFKLTNFDPYQQAIIESDESQKERDWLNKHSDAVQRALLCGGAQTSIDYNDPATIGGRYRRINLIENVPYLYQFNLGPDIIVDSINKALGNYEADFNWSVVRAFLPWFWLEKVIGFVASVPFKFLGSLGLPEKKIERSLFGRLIKGTIQAVLWVMTTFSVVWVFLNQIGVLKPTDTLQSVLHGLHII